MPDENTILALSDVLANQRSLEEEAAAAIPHDFSRCTYPLGPIRQAVYLCITCKAERGICSACSVSCHADHEQVELFPKRDFRCDCPTEALEHPCSLHTTIESINKDNRYGQNYLGKFCRCGRPYDAATERETMIQCLACEDWYHESCLNLRERPSSRSSTPAAKASEEAQEDSFSTTSDSELPPPLISADEYDVMICRACVDSIPTVKRYAGTSGAMVVIRDDANSKWRIVGFPDSTEDEDVDVGTKRPRPADTTEEEKVDSKRAKASTSDVSAEKSGPSSEPCLAPSPNATVARILASPERDLSSIDVFLTDGWRSRWCHCKSCLPSLEARPYLLEEEDTYEPPEDPDSGLSLEEHGMRALQKLPRERQIDGILAFNSMRDELLSYLRPFAQEGRVVDEAAIRSFFEAKQSSNKTS